MQFDLLQNELFPTDDTATAPSKKPRSTPDKPPADASELVLDSEHLPPLPDSLLSALAQPPEAEFHDDMESDEVDEHIGMALAKAPNAFKTISEVASILDVPQHVLRFWESKFPQIKPVKSRGGRRYYRPEDMDTLHTIKDLLYKQGYTIKGAKKAIAQVKKGEVVATAEAAVPLTFEQALAALPPRAALSQGQLAALANLRNELCDLRDALKTHM
jgi:DNA-binding transcriptional MerR regulator